MNDDVVPSILVLSTLSTFSVILWEISKTGYAIFGVMGGMVWFGWFLLCLYVMAY